MSTSGRIDVLTHAVPPFWAEALPSHGGDPSGWSVPAWSPDAHLRFMERNGITKSMLSLTAPSVVGWEGEERRAMARRVNEYIADLCAKHPGRFGNFATVPLPDVEGSVAEVDYALDTLQAEGIVLLTNYEGVYLGDERYAPLWKILNDRKAVVFIHPGHPQIPMLKDVPGPLVDYPFDTTRNAAHMVVNGVPDKYPDAKIILSHAGGFVPYAVLRLCMAQAGLNPNGPSAADLEAKYKLFYYDTALSSGPMAFPSLLAFADPERILFGSDFPYAPMPLATRITSILDNESGLDKSQLAMINESNAKKMFG